MGKGIWWILGIVVVLLIIWFGFSNNGSVPQTSAWMSGESTFAFGDTSFSGGLVEHEFNLSNTGDQSVAIQDITTNCGCTTAEVVHGPHAIGPYGMSGISDGAPTWLIAPGDDFVVRAIFDPAAHGENSIGDSVERVITLKTDQGNQDISFTATIIE